VYIAANVAFFKESPAGKATTPFQPGFVNYAKTLIYGGGGWLCFPSCQVHLLIV
jgi:hypothetical protein